MNKKNIWRNCQQIWLEFVKISKLPINKDKPNINNFYNIYLIF